MIVKAKRLGWGESLTAEQQLDLDPYDYGTDDLVGELKELDIPAMPEHPAMRICLVAGQEADPNTVRAV